MNKANFEFNLNQTNPWVNMSSGAKVASVIAGLGIAAASVAASIFLAGAALFAGAVFFTYNWISDKADKAESENSIIDADFSEAESETKSQ